MYISRTKRIIERIENGLNHPDLIVEANSKDVFNKEKEKLKKKLVDEYVGKVPNVTKRHINFLVEIFGLEYAEKIDPKGIVNLLKNPERMFSKMRKVLGARNFARYAKRVDKQVPDTIDAVTQMLKKENESLKNQINDLSNRLNELKQKETDKRRKQLLDEFGDFIENRREYRKTIVSQDITNEEVLFFDSKRKKLKIGKVIYDYSNMSDDKFQDVLGIDDSTMKDMSKYAELREEFSDVVTIRPYDGREKDVIISKWLILPKKYHDIIENDEEIENTVEDMIEYESPNKFKNYFDGSVSTKKVIKTFKKLGKLDYHRDKVEDRLRKYGISSSKEINFISGIEIKGDEIIIDLFENDANNRVYTLFKILKNNIDSNIRMDMDTVIIDKNKKVDNYGFKSGSIITYLTKSDEPSIRYIKITNKSREKLINVYTKLKEKGFNIEIHNGEIVVNDL